MSVQVYQSFGNCGLHACPSTRGLEIIKSKQSFGCYHPLIETENEGWKLNMSKLRSRKM